MENTKITTCSVLGTKITTAKLNAKCVVCGCTCVEIEDHMHYIDNFSGTVLHIDNGTKRGVNMCSMCFTRFLHRAGMSILNATTNNKGKAASLPELRKQIYKQIQQDVRDDLRHRRAVTFFSKEFGDRLRELGFGCLEHGNPPTLNQVDELVSYCNDNLGFTDEFGISYVANYRIVTDLNNDEVKYIFTGHVLAEACEQAEMTSNEYPKDHVIPIAIIVTVHQIAEEGHEEYLLDHDDSIEHASAISRSGFLTVVADGSNEIKIEDVKIDIDEGGHFTIN